MKETSFMLEKLRKFARRYKRNILGAALLLFVWAPTISLAIYHTYTHAHATWWQWIVLVVGGIIGGFGFSIATTKPSSNDKTPSSP